MKRYAFILSALALATASVPASASFVAPAAYTGTEGAAAQSLPFGSGSRPEGFLQTAYSVTALGALMPGTVITGVGFRLNGDAAAPAGDLVYSDFTIRIGQSAKAVGSLTGDFASNYGADTIVARSGALTIAAGSFVPGAAANPFFTLSFDTAYTYTGGPLLLTLEALRTDGGAAVFVDAIAQGGGLTDTSGKDSFGFPLVHFYNAPIVAFQTGAVPEPGTWALMLVALATVGGVMRSQNARRRAFA